MNTAEISHRNLLLYRQWYNAESVQYGLIRGLYHRAVDFIEPFDTKKTVRMMKVHSVQHLRTVMFHGLNVNDKQRAYNLYRSLALYECGIPDQTLNLAKRDNTRFLKDHWNEMESYDFVLDIDAPSCAETMLIKDQAQDIWEYLDKHEVPFVPAYSGRGFHFHVPGKLFKGHSYNPRLLMNIYQKYRIIAEKMKVRLSCPAIDTSIYDPRRVIKIPYSLAVYKDEPDLHVAFPFLSYDEFHDFTVDKAVIDEQTIRRAMKWVYRRGERVFNPDGNVDAWMKDLGV